MNDVEEMLTDHLERTAARARPRPDLDRVLRSAQAPATTAPPLAPRARARRLTRRNGWVCPLLATAAAAAAVAGTVVAVRTATGTSSESPPVTMDPGDTNVTPTPTPDDGGVRLPAQGPLGTGGYAVLGSDHVTVYRPDGTVAGEGAFTPEADQVIGGFAIREGDGELVLSPTEEDAYAREGLAGEDCAELDTGGGATVETCRTSPDDTFGRELVYVAPDGTRRTLTTVDDVAGGSATQPAAGHWARAALSPDGAWIAAELSGECEVPTVFLIRVADGNVVRADAQPLDQNAEPEESRLLGWDGVRALVAMSQGGCGSTSDPGVRAVDPDTRAITELTDLASVGGITTDHVVPWHGG